MDVLKRIPVREQDAKERATNFKEVCLGYNKEEAMEEASRCINCKNAQCVKGCPVAIQIPQFIEQVKNGNIEEAYRIISESSALPAVCGRVCPQESQCEGKCIRGFKGDPISIGKLERFVADWARENGIKPTPAAQKNGKKVAVKTTVKDDVVSVAATGDKNFSLDVKGSAKKCTVSNVVIGGEKFEGTFAVATEISDDNTVTITVADTAKLVVDKNGNIKELSVAKKYAQDLKISK